MNAAAPVDVIIAGAGPVGCVLGLLLARASVSVCILEAEPQLIQDLRGSTFHPPTLDMLDEVAVSEELIARGLVTPMLQYRDLRTGLVAEFDHGLLQGLTSHPYRLQCEQFKLTAIAVEKLAAFPHARLEFNSRVVAISQNAECVTVEVSRVGEDRTRYHGRYLVGCDGSRSAVRKRLEIDFEGFTYPEHFVTASATESVDDIVPGMGHVAYISDPESWCVLIHAPEYWRFLFPVPVAYTAERALDEAYLQGRLHEIVPYEGQFSIGHRTLYAVNQRVAASYVKGRALLAGDAAHVNNPLGGMGMNGGLHDAFNLAEKLIAVLRDAADPELLELYDRQRRPIAIEYVQRQTIQNKKTMENRDPVARKRQQDELRAIAADRSRSIEYLKQTSMLNAVARSRELT